MVDELEVMAMTGGDVDESLVVDEDDEDNGNRAAAPIGSLDVGWIFDASTETESLMAGESGSFPVAAVSDRTGLRGVVGCCRVSSTIFLESTF